MGSLSTDLPDDLMIKILSQLPVESILRFKSVSQSWNSLLSSSSFATTHSLSSSALSPTFPLLVLEHLISYIPPSQPLSLSNPTFSGHRTLIFQPKSDSSNLACSQGMVCFQDFASPESFDLFVGNPATGNFAALPAPSQYFIVLTPGFDVDPISRNFKILAFGYPAMGISFQGVQWFLFCSIASNWRPIREISIQSLVPYFDCRCRYGEKMVCIRNTFYTICHDGPKVVAFDVERETWDQILTPENADQNNFFQIQLWNGRVSVSQILEGFILKMWVLSEEKIWVQVIQLGLESSINSNLDMMYYDMRPVLLMGDTLFIRWRLKEESVVAYNVKNRTHRLILEGYPLHSVSNFEPYRPTLFSL
ncbi:hypothetical protein AMTRI_Chr07g24520 [Amborella trichopoda]